MVLLAAMLWGTTGTAQSLAPAGLSPYWVGALRLAVASAFFAVLAWRLAPARSGPGRAAACWPGGGLHGRLQPELLRRREAARRGPGHGAGHWQRPHLGRAAAGAVARACRPRCGGWARCWAWPAAPPWRWTRARPRAPAGHGAVPAGRAGLCRVCAGQQAPGGAGRAGGGEPGGVRPARRCCRCPWPALLGGAPALAPRTWGVVLYLGLVATGLAYLLFSAALRHISGATGVTLALAEPVTAFALAVWWWASASPPWPSGAWAGCWRGCCW